MKKKNSPMLRFVSMLEAIAITATLIIGLSVPAFSAEIDDSLPKEFKELEEIPFEMPMEEGDLSLEKLRYAELSESELPAVIDKQSADEMRHVNRLKAQEPDENTVMFQNRDASKTVYIYSSPVKDGERDLSADEINRQNNNAFSFESGCFFVNNKNAVTDRLLKGAEKGIRDYAIGCASIVTESGITIDITERLRNIAGTDEGIQSGIELEENEREALTGNEGLLYLTLTYSDISGIFSIKNNYDSKHITFLYPNNRLYTHSTLISIAGQWIFGYHSYGYGSYYDIRPLGKQWYHLGYSTSYTTVIAGDYQTVTTGNRYWTLDIVDEDEIYFHAKTNDSYIINNELELEDFDSESDYPEECSFRLTNPQVFYELYAIEIPGTYYMTAGESLDSAYSLNPSETSVSSIVWYYYSNDEELEPENGEIGYQTISNVSTVCYKTIYCKDVYSDLISDELTVKVYPPCGIGGNCRLTYMIRPVYSGSTDYSKLLTMGGATSGTNTVSVAGFYNGATAYSAKWTNASQTFSIYKADGTYKIGATLSADQYLLNNDIPLFPTTGPVEQRIREYDRNAPNCNYHMVYKTDVPNYLKRSGSSVVGAMQNAADTNWHIIKTGDISYHDNDEPVGKYVIYQICGAGNNVTFKALKHSGGSNGIQTVTVENYIAGSALFEWSINEVGLDIPLIKQTQHNWCGFATLLQIMYGAGTAGNLQIDTSHTNILHQQMNALIGSSHAGSAAMSQWAICSYLNNTSKFTDGSFDNEHYSYHSSSSYNRNLIVQSLNNGWAPFFLTRTHSNPYMANDPEATEGSHYICIIGYDSVSDCVLISNCHYLDTNYNSLYGIFAIPEARISGNISILYYSSER